MISTALYWLMIWCLPSMMLVALLLWHRGIGASDDAYRSRMDWQD
ncbi:hypothetical protein ABID65_007718 [Bradyrhizobium sp. S3.9.2]